MHPSATRILSDALFLSPMERAELIDELLPSFDPPEDANVADAGKAAAEPRIHAYEAGQQPVGADESTPAY